MVRALNLADRELLQRAVGQFWLSRVRDVDVMPGSGVRRGLRAWHRYVYRLSKRLTGTEPEVWLSAVMQCAKRHVLNR